MTSNTVSSSSQRPRRLPLRVLMGFTPSRDPDPEKLYSAQLAPCDHVRYLHALITVLAILFVWVVFHQNVPLIWLVLWTIPTSIVAAITLRSSLLRINADHAGLGQRDIVRHGIEATLQGLFWTLAIFLFAKNARPEQITALWTLSSCLMVGAAVAFAALPLAAMGFLIMTGIGGVWMFYPNFPIQLPMLVASYALVLLVASLKYARAFGKQLSTSTELAEKSEVVSLLLREYEDTGADWLWQTDAARRVDGVSPRFAGILGADPADLDGKPLVQILAGKDWESGNFAPALHEIAERLKRRESFSNLILPVEIGGSRRWWELSASPRIDEKGVFLGFRGVGSDVTAERESANKIAQLARFDPLTGLPNRLQLSEALAIAIEAVAQWNSRCAFLMIDLDRFKSVNDTLGHQTGDKLLEQVARRLGEVCGPNEVCGRIGGDEFAVIIRDVSDVIYVEQLALTIIDLLSRPYEVDRHTLYIGASIGSAIAPRDGRTSEVLIRSADLALYRAKDEGGGVHCPYEPRLHVHAEERRMLEIALRHALDKDQLHVVYQPVVNGLTGAVEGFESLVRWTHPEMGAISPAKFIPVAEDARLIAPIGEWVLRTACTEALNWPDHVRVAVNVSAEQLTSPHFVAMVMSTLAQTNLPTNRLELEVTESVFMREGTGATHILEQLLGLGVRLSLDDFGTGYSSLGYLSRTKFNTIKVDRSFVVGAAKDVPESIAIIRAVVALADSLGISTTAEGVETQAQAEMVNRLGCKKIQGYYFGRPMPAIEARSLFRQGKASAVA